MNPLQLSQPSFQLLPQCFGIEFTWEYVDELEKSIPVYEDILSPSESHSTSLFFQMIDFIKDELKDKKVLELGCGSGALTSKLASICKEVVAVDVSTEAVLNTRHTLSLEEEEVSKKVRVLESNVYDSLDDEKFDYIIFNNPLIAGPQQTNSDRKIYSGKEFEVPLRTIAGLHKFLNCGGKAYMLAAEFKEKPGLLSHIRSLCGYEDFRDVYWNIDLMEEVIDYLKPYMSMNVTKFSKEVSIEPEMNFSVVEVLYE